MKTVYRLAMVIWPVRMIPERMADLLSILDRQGAKREILPVMFEFQKGSNEMLLRHK